MTQIILLLGLGLVLIVAEVFVPSMGVLGLAASLCIIGAVAWAFTISSEFGVKILLAAALLVPTLVVVALKLMPYSPIAKRFVAKGFTFEDGRAVDARDSTLSNAEGVAESVLRPSGVARLGGRRVDVVSRGEMIEAGEKIRVIEIEGNRVVVARALESRIPPPPDPSRGEA
jgi:membrane-bound serine protease (ClpP class)